MAEIKAIETSYKGYRFRSRLEARWAVFFDELGLKWEYEPEGYETPAGWYLPDFSVTSSLGDRPFWVEIKPRQDEPRDGQPVSLEERKLSQVCEATNRHGFLLMGDPVDFQAVLFHKEGFISGSAPSELFAWTDRFDHQCAVAALVARGARFEHGERGAAR